jgi:hypothetical protein
MQMNISGKGRLQRIRNKIFLRKYLLLFIGIAMPFNVVLSQKYFQQKVNYKIDVTLNDKKHELNAFESIEYINNSPDTLRYLYFHLWPNAYSDNNTQLAKELLRRDGKSNLFNDPVLRGYIDSLDFEAEGQGIIVASNEGFPDICQLLLNRPLYPGDSINITTPFHVRFPEGVTSRMGHIGESYQVSQWYPKPAVYDRSGWHEMPYLDQGEFYSEFGNFDVNITLPSNYIVGATGNLQNEEEKQWLDKISSDTAWMRIPDYITDNFPPSSKQTKTLRFKEENIHDFAWFADKRYHVLKGKVKLPESGREVITWAMFTNQEAYLWNKSIPYIKSALWYFSRWNGDYPYNNYTAVQSALNAGSGMEYPGLTVVGITGDPYLLDDVIAHEICHSWFYSALGSDERRYPFMDESITTANETRYMELRYPDKRLWETEIKNRKIALLLHAENIPEKRVHELEWLIPARINKEQSINLPAPEYSYSNYSGILYSKAAQGFNYLRSYLGDAVYDTLMHKYYTIWKNKHPAPADLREVFESNTGKDLSWFFDDFIGTTKRLDYKIVRINNNKILIKNKGELNSPLLIAGMDRKSIVSQKWEDGFKGRKWFDVPPGNISEIKIDPDHKMTELFRLNNNIRTSGLFRKSDPVQLQFLYTVEDPEKRYLIYFPSINWNNEDGFMAGVALENGTLIPKPVEYFIMPLYTFRNPGITGYGKIIFNKIPYKGFCRLASLTLEAEQYGAPGPYNYDKAKIGLDLYLRYKSQVNPLNQKIYGYFITASDLNRLEKIISPRMRSYFQLGYSLNRNSVTNPFSFTASSESGHDYQKTSIEFIYKYSYAGKKNGLELRTFAGTMFKSRYSDPYYSFSPSGRSGEELYLYEGVFPGRFSEFPKTFFSRQMSLSEGGLASPVNDSLGYSHWLISVSLNSSLPGFAAKLPFKPFINLLLNDHGLGNTGKPAIFYEAGIKAGIWEYFEIYFPFIVSDNIKVIRGSMKDRIRFVFRLDKLNPVKSKS